MQIVNDDYAKYDFTIKFKCHLSLAVFGSMVGCVVCVFFSNLKGEKMLMFLQAVVGVCLLTGE